MNNPIEVSIVIPTFNREKSLNYTIDSLIAQTYPKDKYEIIVVDDGSSDGTGGMVQKIVEKSSHNIRYFMQDNQGQSAARNLGIKKSKGGVIGFTDDDCIANPNWIERASDYFKKNPGIGGLAGPTTPDGKLESSLFKKGKTVHATRSEGPYPTCNIFYSKKALQNVGGFDSSLRRMYEDYDLTQRIQKKGFKIDFSTDLTIKHSVEYISYLSHLMSMKKYEYTALYFKKHPDIKKDLTFGFVTNKKHVYPFFTFLALLSLLTPNRILTAILILAVMVSYSWGNVVKDGNIKKYPIRLLSFPTRLPSDTIRMYYTLKGAIKYRCLIL